ncbi:MAG: lysophospholipid acyltransferase family protein [Leptolyngbyaceae cyanobacterium MO_188.B28]|nr:lysophospholipid acyltransferase family protein [Leptolyngbyaceae cyanobacterium MO_188.B28]
MMLTCSTPQSKESKPEESKPEAVRFNCQFTSSKCSPWLTPLAYFLACRVVIPRHFGRINISGQEHLPLTGPVILAPTHRSRWDSLMIPYATGRRVTGRDLRYMVTADEMRGLQGWLIRRLGGFPVNVRRPAISSLRHGVELLQQGEMMVIYPEGNIFRDGRLRPLKPGLARLALQAELSQSNLGGNIVPIHLSYDQSYPTWGCQVSIKIGAPLAVKAYISGAVKDDARWLTNDLKAALLQLSNSPGAKELAIAAPR